MLQCVDLLDKHDELPQNSRVEFGNLRRGFSVCTSDVANLEIPKTKSSFVNELTATENR